MTQPPKAHRARRTDEEGRAFAGSQMHLQVWANRRSSVLSGHILAAYDIDLPPEAMRWLSPIEVAQYREYRDGSFLRAIGEESARLRLRQFWPSGGPVWDGLAQIDSDAPGGRRIFLIEAKSYPEEVHGRGCQATVGSEALATIRRSLDRAAQWLNIQRTPAWEGRLYQSANRIAHLYFLREVLKLNAYMVNVCFVGDPRRPTDVEAWHVAHAAFRAELGMSPQALPWLTDITVAAGNREELLVAAT